MEARGWASLGVKVAWLVPALSPEAGGCGCRESEARRPWASGVLGHGASTLIFILSPEDILSIDFQRVE